MNVLLVDDGSGVLESITAALLQAGHSVVGTGDGGEALRLYKQKEGYFDLVLTDIDHAGIDGIELAGTIRKLSPKQPIAFQTANSSCEDSVVQQRMAAYAVGDIPRIVKPYRMEQLLLFVVSLGVTHPAARNG